MPEFPVANTLLDAETEFRRRLAVKLSARGYAGKALEDRIEELLRMPIPLRLLPDAGDDSQIP